MNIELICKTILEINNSWVSYSYLHEVTGSIFMYSFLFLLWKCFKKVHEKM